MLMIRGRHRRGAGVFVCWVLLFGWAALLVAGARADTFKAHDPGTGSVPITGPWQFHTSDDMVWASPAFDDSHWEQIRGDDTWGSQTHPGHTGFAWYRRRIDITGADKSLAIMIPPVDDVYELYWNGQKMAPMAVCRLMPTGGVSATALSTHFRWTPRATRVGCLRFGRGRQRWRQPIH